MQSPIDQFITRSRKRMHMLQLESVRVAQREQRLRLPHWRRGAESYLDTIGVPMWQLDLRAQPCEGALCVRDGDISAQEQTCQ